MLSKKVWIFASISLFG
ncbi:MAG: KxYKxGKxW signal peptide domain-containing protein [Flavobacterium sp.]